MEDVVFLEMRGMSKTKYDVLMRLALAEAREDASENVDRDVIVVGTGSVVDAELMNDAYKVITDEPSTYVDTSRQSFKSIAGKKSRW